jgi:hypothetical protein
MVRRRKPQRMIQILNILGAVNMIGMLFILIWEHRYPVDKPFISPSLSTMMNFRLRNRHKGINETLIWLEKAGVTVPIDYPRLPPWWSIEEQYGAEPRILGLDRCRQFQSLNQHRPDDINIAPAGLFNSGTNFLYQLLQENCNFQGRSPSAYHGRAFQPPWGKHTPREYREIHRIDHPLYMNMKLEAVLPIVLIRHPYDWLKSVCNQPYAVHWRDRDENRSDFVCPWIVHEDNQTQEVIVTYGSGLQRYESVAHLWNRWYRGYFDSMAFPRIMIRMEDLIFYPHKVIPKICHCAGATLSHGGAIKVPLESAKQDARGHQMRYSTTYLQAVIKYGNLRTWERFPLRDRVAARGILDNEMMETFGYQHPIIKNPLKKDN